MRLDTPIAPKIGDLVKLKSGGPTMTVNREIPDPSGTKLFVCVWFDDHEKLQAGEFAPASLDRQHR